jgi:hypothetical protein
MHHIHNAGPALLLIGILFTVALALATRRG